jgi:protein-S-isoprenylcysteine O-methyltransferase Ste14
VPESTHVRPGSGGQADRAHAFAWIYLCAHLAAHVVEEAATGFLAVWNPVLAGWSQRTGLPLPQFTFGTWLGVLIVAVVALTALTPRVARGAPWAPAASYIFAAIMVANGVHHLLSPLYLGRFLPGQFSSPLLIAAAVWLIVQTRAISRPSSPAGDPARQVPTRAVVETAVFFLAAPGTVALWIPYALTGWELPERTSERAFAGVAGGVLIAAGAAALVECFARFALVGRGTPSPASPTTSLVVSGLYRYTRNPMYVAVATLLLGQTLLFGSGALLTYSVVVWLAAHTFVVSYEEPTLRRRYGPAYDDYRANVPRWIPRLHPWTQRIADTA